MKLRHILCFALALTASSTMAATIDFEDQSLGVLFDGTTIEGAVFDTNSPGFGMSLLQGFVNPDGSFDTRLSVWGTPTGHGGVLRLDFVGGPISQISAHISDVNHTPVVIDAFDASGVLIGRSPAIASEGLTSLSFASAIIDHVTIHDNGFDFFVDDISFSRDIAPVPLPASAWLLLTGLVMLAGVKRKSALVK